MKPWPIYNTCRKGLRLFGIIVCCSCGGDKFIILLLQAKEGFEGLARWHNSFRHRSHIDGWDITKFRLTAAKAGGRSL